MLLFGKKPTGDCGLSPSRSSSRFSGPCGSISSPLRSSHKIAVEIGLPLRDLVPAELALHTASRGGAEPVSPVRIGKESFDSLRHCRGVRRKDEVFAG